MLQFDVYAAAQNQRHFVRKFGMHSRDMHRRRLSTCINYTHTRFGGQSAQPSGSIIFRIRLDFSGSRIIILRYVLFFVFFLSLVNLAICHSLGLRAIIFFLFSFFCIGREIERIRTKGTYTYSMQPKHQTITTMINKNNIGWNDGGQKRRILSVSA